MPAKPMKGLNSSQTTHSCIFTKVTSKIRPGQRIIFNNFKVFPANFIIVSAELIRLMLLLSFLPTEKQDLNWLN
jgi:S-adenosylmethionine:tRNA-ribosyltransferase-isomerase (queuine synthetase)